MGINISEYIAEVQNLMTVPSLHKVKKDGLDDGKLFESHIINIILIGIFKQASEIQREIHNKVEKVEGTCYGVPSNEMIMLGEQPFYLLGLLGSLKLSLKTKPDKRNQGTVR